MSDNLSEFLLARIAEAQVQSTAEDEAKREIMEIMQGAIESGEIQPGTSWNDDAKGAEVAEMALPHLSHWNPTRVLAECEAKRRIIAKHGPWPRNRWSGHGTPYCMTCMEDRDAWETSYELYPCPTLRYLALPYTDHPDYRQEWKP